MPLLVRLRIIGHSMEPRIKNGELVLLSGIPYWFKSPRINDIVAFKDSRDTAMVKRITEIKNGRYFVLGDNKNESLDSRKFGYITKKQIIGKIIYKL